MEHLVASLLLPLFVIVVFAGVMNIKAEAILIPLFSLLGAVLKLVLDLVLVLVRVLGGLVIASITRLFNVRK